MLLRTFMLSLLSQTFYTLTNAQTIQYIGGAQFRDSTGCTGAPDLISYFQTESCSVLGEGVNYPAIYTCQQDGTVLQQLFNMSDATCSGESFRNETLSIGECQGPFLQFPEETSNGPQSPPGFQVISCDSNPPPFGSRPELFPEGEGNGQLISTGIYPVLEDICSINPVIAFFQRPNNCGLNLNAAGFIVSSELLCIRDENDPDIIFLDQNRYFDPNCRNLSENLVLPANVCQTNLFNGTVHVISRCDNVLFPSSNETTQQENDTKTQTIIGSVVGAVICLMYVLFIATVSIFFFLFGKRSENRLMKRLEERGLLEGIHLIDSKKLDIKEELGRGFTGRVDKAQYGEIFVAIKFSHSEQVDLEKAAEEFGVHSRIPKHQNVVEFKGFTFDYGSLGIVLEYCDNGSLKEYLHNHREENDFLLIYNWLIQISCGLLHIHNHEIIHRDIAARNILLSSEKYTKTMVCKIADFGFSKSIEENEEYYSTANAFPIKWLAPEGLRERKFIMKSDVWSFGILVLEILTKADPFPEVSKEQFFLEWKSYLSNVSSQIPQETPQVLKRVLADEVFQIETEERCDSKFLHNKFNEKKFRSGMRQQTGKRGSFHQKASSSDVPSIYAKSGSISTTTGDSGAIKNHKKNDAQVPKYVDLPSSNTPDPPPRYIELPTPNTPDPPPKYIDLPTPNPPPNYVDTPNIQSDIQE